MTRSQQKGFTLVELVIVITVLGVLAAVAVPKFFDFAGDSKQAACKAALGGVRAAIANYYSYTATPAGGGSASYPTLVQLTTAGTVMSTAGIPNNPYSSATSRNAVIAGTSKGTPETDGTDGGWCYKAATGEFWADTASGVGEAAF